MGSEKIGLGLRDALKNASSLPVTMTKNSGYMLYSEPSWSIIYTMMYPLTLF